MSIEYLSLTQIAKQLGITKGALSTLKLPEPDAHIGKTRGWLPETIETWETTRQDTAADHANKHKGTRL